MTDQLTERQGKILDYIRYVTKVRSYPPSVREIGEAVGLSSSSTVHNHLNQLERRQPTLEDIFLRYVQERPERGEVA